MTMVAAALLLAAMCAVETVMGEPSELQLLQADKRLADVQKEVAQETSLAKDNQRKQEDQITKDADDQKSKAKAELARLSERLNTAKNNAHSKADSLLSEKQGKNAAESAELQKAAEAAQLDAEKAEKEKYEAEKQTNTRISQINDDKKRQLESSRKALNTDIKHIEDRVSRVKAEVNSLKSANDPKISSVTQAILSSVSSSLPDTKLGSSSLASHMTSLASAISKPDSSNTPSFKTSDFKLSGFLGKDAKDIFSDAGLDVSSVHRTD